MNKNAWAKRRLNLPINLRTITIPSSIFGTKTYIKSWPLITSTISTSLISTYFFTTGFGSALIRRWWDPWEKFDMETIAPAHWPQTLDIMNINTVRKNICYHTSRHAGDVNVGSTTISHQTDAFYILQRGKLAHLWLSGPVIFGTTIELFSPGTAFPQWCRAHLWSAHAGKNVSLPDGLHDFFSAWPFTRLSRNAHARWFVLLRMSHAVCCGWVTCARFVVLAKCARAHSSQWWMRHAECVLSTPLPCSARVVDMTRFIAHAKRKREVERATATTHKKNATLLTQPLTVIMVTCPVLLCRCATSLLLILMQHKLCRTVDFSCERANSTSAHQHQQHYAFLSACVCVLCENGWCTRSTLRFMIRDKLK